MAQGLGEEGEGPGQDNEEAEVLGIGQVEPVDVVQEGGKGGHAAAVAAAAHVGT